MSPFQLCCLLEFTLTGPLLQYPDEALLDYFMLDHVAHSKFNALSTPKEEK